MNCDAGRNYARIFAGGEGRGLGPHWHVIIGFLEQSLGDWSGRPAEDDTRLLIIGCEQLKWSLS